MAKQIKDISKKKRILRINVMISARECVTCHVHVSYPVVGGNWFLTQLKKPGWLCSHVQFESYLGFDHIPDIMLKWNLRNLILCFSGDTDIILAGSRFLTVECRSGFWRLIIKFSPCSHCYCFLLLAVISERGKKLVSVELVHYTV